MKKRFCLYCGKDISKYPPASKYCRKIKCQKFRITLKMKKYYKKKKVVKYEY